MLSRVVAIVLGLGLSLCSVGADNTTSQQEDKPVQESQEIDKYGGSLDLHFGGGKGFFRAKYSDNRWWLVTPDDNAFLTFGLNHFHANLWKKEYNTQYWQSRFGAGAYTEQWREQFSAFAFDLMHETLSNTFGYHNEDQIASILSYQGAMPYIRQYTPLKLSSHLNPTDDAFVDIFDTEFESICSSAAREQVAPYVDDKYIVGFAMCDIPTFTQIHAKSVSAVKAPYVAPTWPQVLRNLGATSKGKQRYVETMQSCYGGDIAQFNTTYSTDFDSWSALLAAENWRTATDYANSAEVGDNNEFGKICIDQYYKVAAKAFRDVDPNHLFLGDKLNANLRDAEELALVVEQSSKYTDVILIQYYGSAEANAKILDKIGVYGKPIINGDGGFGAYGDAKMPNPQRPTAANQSERAEWFIDYASSAFANPNFVGYHICGVIDAWNSVGTQKPGIINPQGVPHQEVIDAMKTISFNMYNYHK